MSRNIKEWVHRRNASQSSSSSSGPRQLDHNGLWTGLESIAKYIAKEQRELTVILFGGSVNTLYLRSRTTTRDVNLFNDGLTASDAALLERASQYAVSRDKSGQLTTGWLKNHNSTIPNNHRRELTVQAVANPEVIFTSTGLVALAAPWHFQLCCKIDKLTTTAAAGTSIAYDVDDAVSYLYECLMAVRQERISLTGVREWFRGFGFRWSSDNVEQIARINSAFAKKFKIQYRVIE